MPQVQAPMVRQPESPQEAPIVYTPPPCGSTLLHLAFDHD
jgi:hypothetical protein